MTGGSLKNYNAVINIENVKTTVMFDSNSLSKNG